MKLLGQAEGEIIVQSLPSRERELKQVLQTRVRFRWESLPSRERELKPETEYNADGVDPSLPSRERELKPIYQPW